MKFSRLLEPQTLERHVVFQGSLQLEETAEILKFSDLSWILNVTFIADKVKKI